MPRLVPLAALLLLAPFALAQIAGSVFPDMKVGTTGHFRHSDDGYYKTRVVEVIGKDSLLVQVGTRHPAFMVKGFPAKDVADDEIVELRGDWKVTGTTKYEGKTYKVVEPVKK